MKTVELKYSWIIVEKQLERIAERYRYLYNNCDIQVNMASIKGIVQIYNSPECNKDRQDYELIIMSLRAFGEQRYTLEMKHKNFRVSLAQLGITNKQYSDIKMMLDDQTVSYTYIFDSTRKSENTLLEFTSFDDLIFWYKLIVASTTHIFVYRNSLGVYHLSYKNLLNDQEEILSNIQLGDQYFSGTSEEFKELTKSYL